MSKDLLKEAIADAKAVRETAIANAKLALEEAFTPKIQSMLSTKISEELEEEEVEEVDEMAGMKEDEVEEMEENIEDVSGADEIGDNPASDDVAVDSSGIGSSEFPGGTYLIHSTLTSSSSLLFILNTISPRCH